MSDEDFTPISDTIESSESLLMAERLCIDILSFRLTFDRGNFLRESTIFGTFTTVFLDRLIVGEVRNQFFAFSAVDWTIE